MNKQYKTAQEYRDANKKLTTDFFAKHSEFTSYEGGELIKGNYKLVVEADNQTDNSIFNDSDCDWNGIGLDLSLTRNYQSYGESCPVDVTVFMSWVNDRSSVNLDKDDNFAMLQFKQNYYRLPIYMYQHGGTSVNTTGFSCQWDSGLVGCVFISKADFIKGMFYGVKKSWSASKREEFAHMLLESWVTELNDYYNNHCYSYEIIDLREDEVVESCYGFWGEDSGAMAAVDSGLDELYNLIEYNKGLKFKKLKELIKNRVPLSVRAEVLLGFLTNNCGLSTV